MLSASRITPGIASGATLPKLERAGIAVGAAPARLVAIDQRHVGAAAREMPGRADADDAGADHDDGVAFVPAHFNLFSTTSAPTMSSATASATRMPSTPAERMPPA